MFDWTTYVAGLVVLCAAATITWIVSLAKRDVSIVDSLWSVFFVLAAVTYVVTAPTLGPRASLVLPLVLVWAVRLAGYITWRNWGEPEDRRYQAIRARNEPNFAFKSLYLVFILQAVIAWVVSLPLLGTTTGQAPLGLLDLIGVAVCVIGIAFESIGDYQLARFKADPANAGKVMDRGLWRYTRHPNYFGDFCVWWGFYLLALGAGAWWSLPGPLLMSFFLLKVSGVALLEKDIAERRPKYARYIESTNAFFPGPRRAPGPETTDRATTREEYAK